MQQGPVCVYRATRCVAWLSPTRSSGAMNGMVPTPSLQAMLAGTAQPKSMIFNTGTSLMSWYKHIHKPNNVCIFFVFFNIYRPKDTHNIH